MYKTNKKKAKKLLKENKDKLRAIKFVGITGTNGKTTTTTLLYKFLRKNDYNVTLIGTNGIYINDKYYETINTTPGVEKLYEIINESYNNGVRIIIMEVSSHAIVQNRIFGIKFYIKGITNITQDHLDYHNTFEEYKKVKLSFMKKSKLLVNDVIKFKKILNKNIYYYGVEDSYFKISNMILSKNESSFVLTINNKNYLFNTNLLGDFNVYNITLFIGVLKLFGIFNYEKIQNFLNEKIVIPGRMEVFKYNNKTIVVDYAHTPDGIEKILSFNKSIYKEKVLTLFGCGGNRDRNKRKIMGEIASKYSDYLIITSDNPRNEEEINIINDILEGVNINYSVITNRKDAIDYGVKIIDNYNVFLILGRGCENEIKIKNQLIKFNDVEYIKELLK